MEEGAGGGDRLDWPTRLIIYLMMMIQLGVKYACRRGAVRALTDRQTEGPLPLNSTGRHGLFLKSTCDMKPIDMRKNISDMTWAIS